MKPGKSSLLRAARILQKEVAAMAGRPPRNFYIEKQIQKVANYLQKAAKDKLP